MDEGAGLPERRGLEVLPSCWEWGCIKMGGAGCCGAIWGPGTITGAIDGDCGDPMLGVLVK